MKNRTLTGAIRITKRLLAIFENTVIEHRVFWESFNSKLPGIPVRETPTGQALAPAHRFEMKRNVENPELYAPYKTIIEGSVHKGKIESMKVTPALREEDVVILN